MALPNPLPDNPHRWTDWKAYNSPNLYERLCIDFTANASNELIEANCRILLVWWQKKLPLKNQPSNPLAQLLRQGLDEAAGFLSEARTKLLNPEERRRIDGQLREGLRDVALVEFQKLLAFSHSDDRLTREAEERLHAAGEKLGLNKAEREAAIKAELERTGVKRAEAEPPPVVAAAPVIPVPVAPVPVAPVLAVGVSSPFDEFRKLLKMSRLCLDGDEMSDDNRDAMCNLGESLGLTGGQAEDLIDEYLEGMANPANSAVSHAPSPVARPAAVARGTPAAAAPAPSPAPVVVAKKVINISPAARLAERQIHPNFVSRTGIEMFLIPSGRFQMGSVAPGSQVNEEPVTPVTLSCFYLARYPVTNAQYETFAPAHRNKRMPCANDAHPAVFVNYEEAMAFCEWLGGKETRKYRLPTEAEWEYAARGEDGRVFPWGNALNAGNLANFADARTKFAWRDPSIDDGFAESSPIGSYPRGASPFGIEDMAGNVFEWCFDWVEAYKGREVVNPRGTKMAQRRIIRGGSWRSMGASLRASARNSNIPTAFANDLGFRIACECRGE